MTSKTESAQQLIDRRNNLLQEASEARNVDDLMKWYAEDATFCNVYQNLTMTGKSALHAFYTAAYTAIPTFKVISSTSTGTAEFVACELECRGTAGIPLPDMGVQAGETFVLKGVSLFRWRWEGDVEKLDDDSDDEAVRGWKIVQERAYFQVVK